MDKEQVQETTTEQVVEEVTPTTLQLMRTEIVDKRTGKAFKSNAGNTCYSYAVHGKSLLGREIRADFIPKDKSGFGALDEVYAYAEKFGQPVYLVYTNSVNIDLATGRKRRSTTYQAVCYYADGMSVEANLRPKQDSDKAYLNIILGALELPKIAM